MTERNCPVCFEGRILVEFDYYPFRANSTAPNATVSERSTPKTRTTPVRWPTWNRSTPPTPSFKPKP